MDQPAKSTGEIDGALYGWQYVRLGFGRQNISPETGFSIYALGVAPFRAATGMRLVA